MGISCVGGGAEMLLHLIRMGLANRGLTERVIVGWAACFGYCQHGPNLRIVGGDFLHGVTRDTLEEALDRIEQACRTHESDHVSVGTAPKN
jgi:NADH:ubiquinone oxidoreductase subunit E